MTDAVVQNFLSLLDLDNASGARTEEDIFIGSSPQAPIPRVFGGQVLAQTLIAAGRTVADERLPHSMHGYFLRPGDPDVPITFGVQRLRDGKSFSARRVHAYQQGEPILSMIASFERPDEGVNHQDAFPQGVPDPESLPTAAEVLGHIQHPVAQAWAYERPFDIRHIDGSLYLAVDGEPRAYQAVWLRARGTFPDSQILHRAALAYVSDYTILEPTLRRHEISWSTPGMTIASLDHAMWWHRELRVDQWLLYVMESPSASGARGLNFGKFYTQDGVLVATVAQEGLIRIPSES